VWSVPIIKSLAIDRILLRYGLYEDVKSQGLLVWLLSY